MAVFSPTLVDHLCRYVMKYLRLCACVRLECVRPEGITREENRASPLSNRSYRQQCHVTDSKTKDLLCAGQNQMCGMLVFI